MKQEGFNFVDNNENEHWWFLARSNIFFNILKKYNNKIENHLDIGCGTGYFLEKIKNISKNQYGIDPYTYHNQKSKNILKGTAENIPFNDNYFDTVSTFDVLEHLEKPDLAINEIYRVLKLNGYAIISVPTYQYLYGPHDKENEHFTRYNKTTIEKLIDNRFKIVKSSYFNTLLFPMEASMRLLEKLINKKLTKNKVPNKKINKILFNIFNKEAKYLENKNYPFGMSYIIVIQKIK